MGLDEAESAQFIADDSWIVEENRLLRVHERDFEVPALKIEPVDPRL